MASHTHHDHDWASKLTYMRLGDRVRAGVQQAVAERLVGMVGDRAAVVDVGSGTGGMAARLALALQARAGGTVVLVDAVPELLDAAADHVRSALAPNSSVEVVPILGDATGESVRDQVPDADLVWASFVVHHLRDQQVGIESLAEMLRPGGLLALVEGGLGTQCLPWDLGVGAPGLVDRVTAARKHWFADMRAGIPGTTRLPVGWTTALTRAGLIDVTSFSYLVDQPAPVSDDVRAFVVGWFDHVASASVERLDEDDRQAVARLLDPNDDVYVGRRDDLFYLASDTVNLGRRP
jgi:SAM-dependent methyltransferase